MQDLDKILEKEGIKDFDKDIRSMTKRELKKHFSFKSGKLNPTRLLKNLIWQSYTWIGNGKAEPIEGNIRSFWYSWPKPVLSRLGLDVSNRKYTDKMYDVFVELITEHRLFRYVDFGFVDGNVYLRTIGSKNGHLILFVEKKGLFPIVKAIAEKHKATAIAFVGFPSYFTTEFLVRSMARAGLLKEPVHLFGLVDYDPGGYWISHEFVEQLQAYGVEVGDVHSIMRPDLLSKEVVEMLKIKLKKSKRMENWLEKTSGINGEPYGLQADALGGKLIRQVYAKVLEPYLGKPKARGRAKLTAEKAEWLRWLKFGRDPIVRSVDPKLAKKLKKPDRSKLEDFLDREEA